jgi:imidazolonepropionase-like amidohydrolase
MTLKRYLLNGAAASFAALVAACASTPPPVAKASETPMPAAPAPTTVTRAGLDPGGDKDPFPSTYRPPGSRPTAIVNASILTGTGAQIQRGTVVMESGKIVAVGADVTPPAGAVVIDGAGKWVTPGIIDAHSHLGVFPSPGLESLADGNERVDPNVAQVWAEHSIWPQDPNFSRALAGGVTSLLILPGSSNLIGGRSVTVKNVPARTTQEMKFPGAPYSLKMACGENPKRNYGAKGRSPATRMGNIAVFRSAWLDAAKYTRKWDEYRRKHDAGDDKATPPDRDLKLDSLAGVLDGEMLVQNHCYRADEMAQMVDLSKEFGFRITAFHHASEAYKIADILARENVCVATWGHRWGFKLEAYDGIEENVALLESAGACAVIHSDSADLVQRLNQEAAIALSAGRRAGIDISPAQAIKWITANPAKIMGILDRTGTLEPGKMADVVLWTADPFSIYALADKVYIDGGLVYDRTNPPKQPRSDFELGQPGQERH